MILFDPKQYHARFKKPFWQEKKIGMPSLDICSPVFKTTQLMMREHMPGLWVADLTAYT